MDKLLFLDAKNYDGCENTINRTAVRGIIFINDKILLIENEEGFLKLPGGGIEENESDIETLIREVKEETGYSVILDSIRPFGIVEEKRLSLHEHALWHQESRLYFCEVLNTQETCSYTNNELREGFHPVLYNINDAISNLEKIMTNNLSHFWKRREYQTLLLIKDYLKL